MKNIKIPFIILLLILFTILSGCSASNNSTSNENDNNGTNFVTGKILMVNNEPFSEVAIVTDKSVYLMDIPEDVRKTLYQNQGSTARVYYTGYSINNESVKVLKVEKVEIMQSN
ncbi:MAG: hypothetical protein WCE54_20855 [Ignavibacteriaceae bacterium]